jgi:UDP-glucose 4-epimerase
MSKPILCLVIGANGFVGSHLVDELAEAGYRVRAFDRFSKGSRFNEHKSVEIIAGDIFDDIAVLGALQDVDYVFHSFSATTPFLSDTDPYSDITMNLLRNVQLFEKCVEAKIKKIMFMSSGGAVYGSVAEHTKATENDMPLPVSPYGIGKLGAEYYLEYFNRKYGLNHVSYRLTNPYGPRQLSNNNQGVIPTFVNKITENQEIQIYGDGTSSRDYIYIRDATKMMVDSFMKDTGNTIYNIGSGQQTSINQIVKAIESAMNVKAQVTYKEAPKTFLQKTELSIQRFIDDFGMPDLMSFEDGVAKTLT